MAKRKASSLPLIDVRCGQGWKLTVDWTNLNAILQTGGQSQCFHQNDFHHITVLNPRTKQIELSPSLLTISQEVGDVKALTRALYSVACGMRHSFAVLSGEITPSGKRNRALNVRKEKEHNDAFEGDRKGY